MGVLYKCIFVVKGLGYQAKYKYEHQSLLSQQIQNTQKVVLKQNTKIKIKSIIRFYF